MARNLIVINVDLRETRVALIENGVIAELQIERTSHRGTVGNIVLGRVTRVLPGMQAAFIDVGQERAAFLHVEDLIRPDDFDTYLEGAKHDQEQSFRGDGTRRGSLIPNLNAREGGDDDREAASDEQDAAVESSDDGGADADPDSDDEALIGGAAEAPSGAFDHDEDDSEDDDEADEALAEDEAELDSDPDGDAIDLDEDDVEDQELAIEPSSDVLASAILGEAETETVEEASERQERVSARARAAYISGTALEERDGSEPPEAPSDDAGALEEAGRVAEDDAAEDDAADGDVLDDGDEDAEAEDSSDEDAEAEDSSDEDAETEDSSDEDAEAEDSSDEDAEAEDSEGESEASATEGAAAGDDSAPRKGRRRRRRRRRGGTERQVETARDPSPRSVPQPAPARAAAPVREAPAQARGNTGRNAGRNGSGRGAGRGNNQRGGRAARPEARAGRGATPLRVTRSVPITQVVKEGDEVIVQISKEPIGTKGARVTSHVSLPGRYVVYLPTVEHVGISKRIGSMKERGRLRKVIESMKPTKGGLIVRTVAEGLTKKQLKADVGYLIRLWAEVARRKEKARAPEILYSELDLVLKVARDLFTDEVERVVIDDRDQYGRLVRFVEMFLPERVKDIELYQGNEPIFDAYGIEDEIGRALSRKVPLPSGGSLIVDQAEALTAIDVNTGRYVGKGSRDLEETALKTNLEAVEEIAYQLRFRNIGGLVILDLIDMEKSGNREKVWRSLEQALARDKAKTTINRISDLGLIEMTRKRTRESLGRMLHEPCFYCDGTGQIQSRETIAYEILRQIRRERLNLPGYSVVVNAHPAIVDFLKGEARDALHEGERRFARKIELVSRQEYHIEQYDLHGK